MIGFRFLYGLRTVSPFAIGLSRIPARKLFLYNAAGAFLWATVVGSGGGKTEIVERMIDSFEKMGKQTTTIEMDNFLLDREFRENKPMGRETTHFGRFKQCLTDILQGTEITIPRYDSLTAMSSHDPQGNLRPGFHGLEVEAADVVFLEGNFPFQMDELAGLISLQMSI